MKTIFNRGFQGKEIGPAVRPLAPAQPTFGGATPAGPAPAAPQRGMAAPVPQTQGPSLPGRTPVPVIPKGSGGPSCPVCRG